MRDPADATVNVRLLFNRFADGASSERPTSTR
jgi:hypothetical protein